MQRSRPYALVGLGLVGGILALLFEPFASQTLNTLLGGGFLAVAVASVTYLIVGSSGPGERGPDF